MNKKTAFITLAIIVATILAISLVSLIAHAAEEQEQQQPERILATAELQRQLDRERLASLEQCNSPFGSFNGVGNGVPAFSNCNDQTISMQDHVVQWDPVGKKVYYSEERDERNLPATEEIKKRLVNVVTGMKWQCVEFARRYLLEKLGLVFQDCEGAVQIWRLTFVFAPTDPRWETRYELQRFANFKQETPPQVGDMVIWPIQKDMPYGHVAIVTEMREPTDEQKNEQQFKANSNGVEDRDTLVAIARIGEQNYHSKQWPGEMRHYARELHVYRRANTKLLAIKDPDGYRTLGWMRPRPDLGPFTGAYSLPDDGVDGVEAQGLPQRVTPSGIPQVMEQEEHRGKDL